jgi:hypothetical protein
VTLRSVASRRLLFATAIVTTLASLPSVPREAKAQGTPAAPTSENRAAAEMLFFTARGLMEADRISDACVKFAESYRLDPAAGTLLNLAVCHEKEGKIASAWGEFRQALSEARRANRADREELAQQHIAALEPELPMLAIEVPKDAQVPDLVVYRNGVPLQSGAWGTELPVDPGKVVIETKAPGFLPKTQTLTIERRERKKIAIEALEPAPIDEATLAQNRVWTTKKRVGLGAMVGGGVLAGVGVVAGILALSNTNKSDDNCEVFDGERRCTQAGVDAMNSARTYAWGANIGIGLGAAALAVGSYLFVTGGYEYKNLPQGADPRTARPATNAKKWDVAVNVGPMGAQGFLTHRF